MAEDETVNFGRRSVKAAAAGALSSLARLASDKAAAARMRLKGPGEYAIPPEQLVAEWRAAAAAAAPLPEHKMQLLCASTLAGWPALSLSDHVLLMDAWGFIQQRQPAGTCFLPRPLLRLMAAALCAEKRAATIFQLNLCAVRCQGFMSTPAADLARSILDAVVHACAVRVRDDYKLAATIGPVLSMQPYVSMSARPQAELQALRRAAADSVNPVEEAVYRRIAWTKQAFACDSFTARSRVAATLARDSMQAHGGNLRATFIKAFGCAPDELELLASPTSQAQAAAEDALEAWRHEKTQHLAAAAVAASPAAGMEGAGAGGVEASGLSICTVHSDGRSEAVAASP